MKILRSIYTIFAEIIQTLVVSLAIFLLVYVFIFRPFQVQGDSMYPNLLTGEYILTSVIGPHLTGIRIGEVIVFKAPPDPAESYIKRVIGLPGDRIELMNGNVYRNGNLLNENSFLNSSVKTYGGLFLKDDQIIIVPKNDYLVMGDNRIYSSDSRSWGFVPKANIIGDAFFIYWPVADIHFIKNPF